MGTSVLLAFQKTLYLKINHPMKRVIRLLFIILFLQIVCILFTLPEYIPSWRIVLKGVFIIVYGYISVLFIIMVFTVIHKNYKKKARWTDWLFDSSLCMFSLAGIVVGLLFTWFIVMDPLFSPRYVKKYTYENANATVYIYDESWLDPMLSVKVRNSWLPIMHKITTIQSYNPNDISFDHHCDCLYIYTLSDTVKIDSKQIMNY